MQGAGRGALVEEAVMWLFWQERGFATDEQAAEALERLKPVEVEFVHDLLADRAGSGSLVELIERRFGPYDYTPAVPGPEDGAVPVSRWWADGPS